MTAIEKINRENPPKRVSDFLLLGMSYPTPVVRLRKIWLSLNEQRTWRSCLKQLLHLYLRLHLRFLCLRPGLPCPNGFYLAGLSISLLVTLSKPWQAHHKKIISIIIMNNMLGNIIQSPYGGPGGSRTRVQNPFHSTSYSLSYYLLYITVNPQ